MGYRTVDQRKADADVRRQGDCGRQMRRKLYASKAWQQMRDLARCRNPLCVDCEAEGKLIPWTDLDHIIDMEDGGAALDLDNVVGRCHSHHSAKTARTRAFGRGQQAKYRRSQDSP
jgi:5-methylcytosine-specific restriction enzyme A